MATNITTNGVVFSSPGITPTPAGSGQAITQTKDQTGKVVTTSGQVAGVVHNNPG